MSMCSTPIEYPHWIEDWWIRFAKRVMKEEDERVLFEKLAHEVQQLSDRFIADERRETLRGYGQERDTLLAYGLFFFPQTFTRVQFPLAELWFRGWRPPQNELRILDIGAGLGSASLGLVHWLKTQAPELSIHVDAFEQSKQSLQWYGRWSEQLAEYLPGCTWDGYPGDLRTIHDSSTLPFKQKKWDLILASFSLNEAFEDRPLEELEEWVERALQRLTPGGVLLLLEPASRVACERLEQLRDRVSSSKEWALWGPCLHTHACPLLKDGRSWCHEVRGWTIPDSLHHLNRRMFRALGSLKFGYLALGEPTQYPNEPETLSLRMVSPMHGKKGRWLGTGCASDGRRLPLELQTRHLSREDKTMLKRVERGDLLGIEWPENDVLTEHPNTGLVRLPKEASLFEIYAPGSDKD